jgi:hypothetical protein
VFQGIRTAPLTPSPLQKDEPASGLDCSGEFKAAPDIRLSGPAAGGRYVLWARPKVKFPGEPPRQGSARARQAGIAPKRLAKPAEAAPLRFYKPCGRKTLAVPGYQKPISSKEKPMPNLEAAIRERAYHLWIADGQPDGQADLYWLNAQREVLTASLESSGSVPAAAVSIDPVTVATKPAKKAKAARAGKSKSRAA